MGRLEGKVAIITGAAGGLGLTTARRFAAEGARVVLADIVEQDGRAAAAGLEAEGRAASFHTLDVTDPQGWRTLIDTVLERHGRLDILVNNAGVSGSWIRDNDDVDGWRKLLDINATSVFIGTKTAAGAMTSGGAIVNISSIMGLVGSRGDHPGYHASKGAVRLYTKAAACRYAAMGIRVNSVHPGFLPAMRTSNPPPERAGYITSRVPLGRAGTLDEVANAVLFLASDEASYVTGAELVVDGGFTAE